MLLRTYCYTYMNPMWVTNPVQSGKRRRAIKLMDLPCRRDLRSHKTYFFLIFWNTLLRYVCSWNCQKNYNSRSGVLWVRMLNLDVVHLGEFQLVGAFTLLTFLITLTPSPHLTR